MTILLYIIHYYSCSAVSSAVSCRRSFLRVLSFFLYNCREREREKKKRKLNQRERPADHPVWRNHGAKCHPHVGKLSLTNTMGWFIFSLMRSDQSKGFRRWRFVMLSFYWWLSEREKRSMTQATLSITAFKVLLDGSSSQVLILLHAACLKHW